MNLNIPIKSSGSTLTHDEFNLTIAAINSKADESSLQYYLTLTGATSAFQAKGTYLVAADLIGKYLSTGTTLFSGSWLDLTNKPQLFSGAYSDLTGKPTLFSGSYADLSGKPSLFSGSYLDLNNKPVIPSIAGLASTAYVDAKVADLVEQAPETLNTLNELAAALGDDPNFATTVSNQIGLKANSLDVYTKTQIDAKAFLTGITWSQITSKPTLFSGSYTDLTSKPDLSLKADLISGKIPVAQLPDITLSEDQFELLSDGKIGIKTSYLMSLGLGGIQLAAPASLSISGATATALTISWSGSTNATVYKLERATNNSFTGATLVYSGSTTSFNNTGLTESSNYFYRVKAIAPSYIDSNYSSISGTTSAAGNIAITPAKFLTSDGEMTYSNGQFTTTTYNVRAVAAANSDTVYSSSLPVTSIEAFWDASWGSSYPDLGLQTENFGVVRNDMKAWLQFENSGLGYGSPTQQSLGYTLPQATTSGMKVSASKGTTYWEYQFLTSTDGGATWINRTPTGSVIVSTVPIASPLYGGIYINAPSCVLKNIKVTPAA